MRPPSPELVQWGRSLASTPLVPTESGLGYIGSGLVVLDPPPPEPIPELNLTSTGGGIELRLHGTAVNDLVVGTGTLTVVGNGRVTTLTVDTPDSAAISITGATIDTVDVTRPRKASLSTDAVSNIRTLLLGDGTFETFGQEPHLAHRVIAQGEDRRIRLSKELRCDILQAPDGVIIEGSHLSAGTLELTTIVLQGPDGGLRIPVGVSNVDLELRHGNVRLHNGGSNEPTATTNLTFRGPGGTVSVDDCLVVDVDFRVSETIELRILNGAELVRARGRVALFVHNGGFLSGDPETGVQLTSIDTSDDHGFLACEGIDFFRMNLSTLGDLNKAKRVTGWWPNGWNELMSRARTIECGVRSDHASDGLRAHYWARVADILRDSSSSGRDHALSHAVAQDAKRRSAAPRSAERALLEVSRFMGYSSQILRPLVLWLGSALFFAFFIRASADGICIGAGCSWFDGFDLYLDALLAPITFVRPLAEGSTLEILLRDDPLIEVLSFFDRVVGTVALGAAAVAASRYLRPR